MDCRKKISSRESTLIKKQRKDDPPQFCDFSCRHAEFAQPDAIGACRKELAVFCTLYKRHNNKNSPCIEKKK
jgi:hypothetical protein